MTVPIRLARRSPKTTAEIQLSDYIEPDVRSTQATPVAEAMTPAVRVPVRLLSAASANSSSAKLLVSPARRIAPHPAALPPGTRPRLRVLRGQKINLEYPVYEGANYMGRRDDAPIDIDLEDQEPADRIWTSRKHAAIHFREGVLEIEDLNSLNGTFVNRIRVAPGQKRALAINDIVQVGTIQLRVVA
ncbi:MAG: FHA domain-containing protein [Gemmataceae bacterium]|nr:FHA domain-containing protein [Gemmataceae bacterium]